ncbi:MAG TPA: hypothetical protein VJN88_07595 [Ktedonobacterales bacterium]|nr:hypothetical protein [Ktedonobacterales bacterium]
MALNKKHDPRLEALILQAAEDVRRVNPHLDAPELPLSEAENAELEHGRQNIERVWDEMDRQRGGALIDELASRAVDDDRGE